MSRKAYSSTPKYHHTKTHHIQVKNISGIKSPQKIKLKINTILRVITRNTVISIFTSDIN